MSATRPLMTILGAGLIAIGLAVNAHAQATAPVEPPQKGPLDDLQESVVDAIEKGLNLLSLAIGRVLPYRLPEVLPNGDIIIRYAPPRPLPPAEPAPDADGQTRT